MARAKERGQLNRDEMVCRGGPPPIGGFSRAPAIPANEIAAQAGHGNRVGLNIEDVAVKIICQIIAINDPLADPVRLPSLIIRMHSRD